MKTQNLNVNIEDVVVKRNVMLRFIEFLIDHKSEENFTFWLEAQIFKYEKDQTKCRAEAERIYNKYWAEKKGGLNVEEDHLVRELAQKLKRPDRTMFMLVQNAIWGLLKLECFPKFVLECGVKDKIDKKRLKSLLKHEKGKLLVELYDTFFDLNQRFPTTADGNADGQFKATILPYDAYQEHLHTTLPTIDELWKDRDLFLAFREYLYQKQSQENLAFWLEVSNYESLFDEKELEKRSQEIFQKFIVDNAPYFINVDFIMREKLKKNLKPPTSASFFLVKDKCWKVLATDHFSDFVTHDLYRACNDETIQFTKSDGGRKRSSTITEYEKFCSSGKPPKRD